MGGSQQVLGHGRITGTSDPDNYDLQHHTYIQGVEKETIILDSTKIVDFLGCPEYYNLQHNERLEKNGAEKKAMNMGSYGHLLLETYYKSFAVTKDWNDSLNVMIKVESPPALDLQPEETKLVIDKLIIYCPTMASRGDFEPESPDTVEMGFSFKLHEDAERLYILEGKLDHYHHPPTVGSFTGMRAFIDHKFQMRRRDLYQKRIQFRNYALATDSRIGICNYIRLTKKVDESTFERVITPYTKIELDLWRKRLIKIYDSYYDQMKRIKAGEPFEHRWNYCESPWGGSCKFSQICECLDQGTVENTKKQMYHQIEEWRPW